ncbi:MAG: HD domain-containing protein [Dysgonamonadaceae bacterium]|jgi:HD superfamily phosphohydrolase|nr:HD domain-containing protein [Dysgonamonadaceae bacterium]
MGKGKYKIFEDSVHGQIAIPEDYVREIIDTRLFQRLKRIEQTSMRPLFPSAHHDRFIHSIGVYHIGKNLFSNIKKNTQQEDIINQTDAYDFIKKNLNNTNCLLEKGAQSEEFGYWNVIETTYEIACLLHDCGHAPFSHAFEDYYFNKNLDNELDTPLNQDITKEYSDIIENHCKEESKSYRENAIEEFKSDLKNCKPKPHERVSAWLVLHNDGFRKQIIDLKGCPLLVARMIIGCIFQNKKKLQNQILNCFIGILNGHNIDADRIDYTIRDNWATGLTPTTINLGRLFASVFIANKSKNKRNKDYVICFKKQGFSELQCLLDEKNYTSYWIFNHNKIKYIEELFTKSVKRLAVLFDNKVQEYSDNAANEQKQYKIENESMYSLFDYHCLISPRKFTVKIDANKEYEEYLYLVSDDDIIYLLKKYFLVYTDQVNIPLINSFLTKNKPYVDEWFSRSQVLVPLWKTHFEYYGQFYKIFEEKSKKIENEEGRRKFLDNEMIDNILFDSAVETIKEIQKEGYIVSTDKPKKILVESEIKKIEPNSIYVKIHDNYCCYSELNLPPKNKERTEYNYPYIFMPKIFNNDSSSAGKKARDTYYIEFYRKTILKKCDKKIKELCARA